MIDHSEFLRDRRVIIADDEPFNLSLIVGMMRGMGCSDVTPASSSTEVINALSHPKPPSFVILDFNMPELTGLQLLKKIRVGATPAKRDMSVLMLTGNADFGLVGAAMELDVDAFLIKPVSLGVMASRLERVLSQPHSAKSVADYDRVDVDAISKRLLSRQPVGLAKSHQSKKAPRRGMAVKVESLRAGNILAEDIRSPKGELLLSAATQLSERLVRRLNELQSGLKLEYVYIFPPSIKAEEIK